LLKDYYIKMGWIIINKKGVIMNKKINISAIIMIVVLFSIDIYIYARPDGVTGVTLKSGSSGCGSCHGTHGDANNLVKVEISGPDTLLAGEKANYKVKISGGSGSNVGTDIAASDGKLANIDNNLKILNNELTHTSAKYFSNGVYTFNFSYTAPSTPGIQTLYADGLSSKPQWNFAKNFNIQIIKTTTGVNNNDLTPNSYSLSQNYPNPFNPTSKINYSIPTESSVKLIVYNILGEMVEMLVNGVKARGNYSVTFDASHLSSGIYFYSIEASSMDGKENYKVVKKMSLIR
jgi:hypothetical protein